MPKYTRRARRVQETHYITDKPVTIVVEQWSIMQLLKRLNWLDEHGYDFIHDLYPLFQYK